MIAFIDLETTGLDPVNDKILEVACIITDNQFRELKKFHMVTSEARHVALGTLDPYVQAMHLANGLWIESASPTGPSHVRELMHGLLAVSSGGDAEVMAAYGEHVEGKRQLSKIDESLAQLIVETCCGGMSMHELSDDQIRGMQRPELGGNSVHFDRAFIHAQMPATALAIHRYRNLDVSSVTALVRGMWFPVWEARPRGGKPTHRAREDIQYSVDLLRYYAAALGPRDVHLDSTDT